MKRFSAVRLVWLLSASLAVLSLLYSPKVWAGSAKGADPSVRQTLNRMSQRLDSLESENLYLRGEVSALKKELDAQTPTVSAMQHHLTETMPKTEQQVASIQKDVVANSDKMKSLSDIMARRGLEIGFRTGYSEVPFDLPGGFYWDAHINHRLLTREDGVPFGDLRGEVAIGLIEGNNEHLSVTTLGGTPLQHNVNTSTSLEMVELQPTLQYTLRTLEPLEPYVLAGPQMAIVVAESSPLNAGQLPLPPQLRQKGLPTVGTAHVFGGAVFGAGINYRLSSVAEALHMPKLAPILSNLSFGPEWRYNVLENGENYQSYSGSIQLGF